MAESAATTMSPKTATVRPSLMFPSKNALYLVMGVSTVVLVGDLLLLAQWAGLATIFSDDTLRVEQIGYRWVHFVAGITWIGLLWFFNWINVPFGKEEKFADIKGVYVPRLLTRALFWFRWGAMLTILAGWGLVFTLYTPNQLLSTAPGQTILTGLILGHLMWFNVWFVIWPNQKRVIGTTEQGGKPDPKWGKQALLASRANTVMSFPMLFMMAGAAHYPLSPTLIAVVLVATGLVSWGVILLTAKA